MKKPDDDKRFQTHIPEPRWQQVVSVIIVAIGILFWLIFVLHSH